MNDLDSIFADLEEIKIQIYKYFFGENFSERMKEDEDKFNITDLSEAAESKELKDVLSDMQEYLNDDE